MAVENITGHSGKGHVTAEAAGALHAGIIGSGKYVLTGGNQFAAEVVSNNLIKIKSGELVNQGRHIRIPVNSYEEVTIQNGAQGMYRSDLIVMRYKKDTSAQVESAELVVIKGKASSSIQASVPRYVSGNILSGATQDDFPLYRVSLNGLTIETDLSEAQIQAYKSLTTFKPTSIISNDANAQMKAEYAADTKAYIDNKLQEIAQALVASASEAE